MHFKKNKKRKKDETNEASVAELLRPRFGRDDDGAFFVLVDALRFVSSIFFILRTSRSDEKNEEILMRFSMFEKTKKNGKY